MISLKEAIAQINQANPIMGSLLKCEKPLLQYCRENIAFHNFHPAHIERQKEYKKFIAKKVESLFTKKEDTRLNLDEDMLLDTTDHHNILNFPTIVGAHLISRLDTILERKKFGDYFVLDTGNVTFSEVLNKRGIMLNGKHINLYPKKDKNKLIGRYPIYEYELLRSAKNSGLKFSKEELAFLEKMQKMIDDIDFSTCKNLSDQITKINYYLWQEFFDPRIAAQARRCITLEHNGILIKYLEKFISEKKDSFVYKMLFEEKFREIILKEFDGIYGAWNYGGKNSGTHFFWAFNSKDGKRYRLKIEKNSLISPENKIEPTELTPEEIIKNLRNEVLIPSILLKFAIVGTYLGTKMMGGPGQTEYASKLQNKWLEILKNYDKKEYELAKTVDASSMNAGDLAFRKNKKGELIKEWGFDIAMHHRFSKKYLDTIKNIKFKHFVYPFMPISYYRLTPAEKRQPLGFKESDLLEGLKKAL